MIIVSLHCQMGNQMFQYAFAQATAKRLYTFFLPFQSNYYYPFKLNYFELDWFTRLVYAHPKIRNQYHRVCRKLIKYYAKKLVSIDDSTILDEFSNKSYFDGFFQSDVYFQHIDKKIRQSFSIKKKYQNQFKQKYDSLFKENKVVVVHIRRADYLEVEFDGLGGQGVALPMAYYLKALDGIEDKEKYQILFVSDDIESVKSDFGSVSNFHFESNAAIVDFQLIQHADIAIIANSTFAWWAAYLSKKKNSRIIAPKYWLGYKVKKEYPAGIETSKFEWVSF